MGGLTAGALLARAGKQVLVLEPEGQPGGYARALRRGAYAFDMADHLITRCEQAGPFGAGVIDTVLRHPGVRDRCEFLRVDDPFYVARYPGFTLAVPHGREAYLDAHLRHFPGEARGLRRLVELSAQIFREALAFPIRPGVLDLFLAPRRFPALFRYRNATMAEVIDRELTDARLKAVYATLWPWVGLPPAQASFLTWAAMIATYVEDGAYYCRGSFQRLADAFAAGLTLAGGELLLGTPAVRILTGDGRVRGVALANGQEIRAPVVISNADARDTFEKLLGPDQVPARFLRRLQQLELSMSVLALYLATDLDARALGAQHETALYTDWDQDRGYTDGLAGQLRGIAMVIPTLTDPSLAPPKEHVVILQTIAPHEPGAIARADNGHFAERMLELAEDVLPGLRAHLTYVEGAAPGKQEFPLYRLGPIYGWALSPPQAGANRLPHRSPVEGLYLVGHWT